MRKPQFNGLYDFDYADDKKFGRIVWPQLIALVGIGAFIAGLLVCGGVILVNWVMG